MSPSNSQSLDEHVNIKPNEEGENEIVFPIWEEGSSSQNHTQIIHLTE